VDCNYFLSKIPTKKPATVERVLAGRGLAGVLSTLFTEYIISQEEAIVTSALSRLKVTFEIWCDIAWTKQKVFRPRHPQIKETRWTEH
jgi:hypothetical protein